jgi:hypothetical protein
MQVSLGGRPHRSDRSQSPQVKSDSRRIVAILLETLAKIPRIALVTRIFSSCAQKIIVHGNPGCIDPDQRGGTSTARMRQRSTLSARCKTAVGLAQHLKTPDS